MPKQILIYSCSCGRNIAFLSQSTAADNARLLDLRPQPAPVLSGLENIPAWSPAVPEPEVQENLLAEYNSLMDKLAEANGLSPEWWSTDLASKNRFTSPLAKQLNSLYACIQAIQALIADNSWCTLIVAGADRPLTRFLLAQANPQLRVRAQSGLRRQGLVGTLRTMTRMARTALSFTGRILLCRRYYRRNFPSMDDVPRHLIKSFAYPSSWKEKGTFNDPFFPGVAAAVAHPLTIALAFGTLPQVFKRMKEDDTVVPLEAYLSVTDPLKAVTKLWWTQLSRPFRVPSQLQFDGSNIAPYIQDLIACGGWHMPLEQYLHRYAGQRIARTHRLASCLITYEGNPWERMFALGLREEQPELLIYGCQHAASPPAAAGIFPGAAEARLAPLPDKVFCTGTAFAESILKHSALKPSQLVPACALRFASLNAMKPTAFDQGPPVLLVALEGVPEAAPMLLYALKQARNMSDVHIRLRAHPAYPFEKLYTIIGKPKMPSNISISKGSSLHEDITASRAVMYWGSTVAAEALLLGRPVIHFDRGDILSYDFLFDLTACKGKVHPGASLAHAFANLIALDSPDFAAEARRFVRNMFAACDRSQISTFFATEVYNDSSQ